MMSEANRDAASTLVGAGARPSEVFPLVVDRVSKGYDVDGKIVPVIGDLSLSLDKGEIVSIVGPSGCGKTTLLNTLCGLIAPDAGRIRWYGRELAGQPQNVGYMLQKDLLLPWRTALGNVMLGLEIRGVAAGEAARSQPRDAGPAGASRFCGSLSFHAFGRDASARGACAHAGE